MDVPEDDQDVKLQRASPEFLADLQRSLDPFLWKVNAFGKRKIRRRVRIRETDRLVALLEPFQELPQLLDPHLQQLVPILADAFLACLQSKPSSKPSHPQLLMTISRAICRLIYTFCKIRGEKVIVRFLGTEARHLELILWAIEVQTRLEDEEEPKDNGQEAWEWEERYLALLWLSQLLFAPFDLASISSQAKVAPHMASMIQTDISGLNWPDDVPSIALRVIPLAIYYLSSAGKERDAAKVLLVRVAMRKDMQELGILHALIKWAISRLRASTDVGNSTYHYIGILSFLAGILKSSIGTTDMDNYLPAVFEVIQRICTSEDGFFKSINASPVVRKANINALRNISVLLLRSSEIERSSEMVEWTIGYLLDSLGDSSTPVRIASSKALSVITLKLAPAMAGQVVEEILTALKKDVLNVSNGPLRQRVQSVSKVNPLEWHGLILTLSQLLYRRSPPPSALGHIITALVDGVNFEQRSTSGSSIGGNVRDAANLGIWALARRYTTDELQAIGSIILSRFPESDSKRIPILQILAMRLVVSASLDPAGNIRRGSSAALQELVGRHPNTIVEGIRLVQTVEYSSIALRSKAMQEVAVQSANLDELYCMLLLDELENWRGIGDPDATARRTAAITFGNIVHSSMIRNMSVSCDHLWDHFRGIVVGIGYRLKSLEHRQVYERHGLVLCLAFTIMCLASVFRADEGTAKTCASTVGRKNAISEMTTLVISILEDVKKTTYRRPELIAEAVSRLLIALYPALDFSNSTGPYLANLDLDPINGIGMHDSSGELLNTHRILALAKELLGKWICRNESEVTEAASEAVAGLFSLLSAPQQEVLVSNWASIISEDAGSRASRDTGVLSALFQVFSLAGAMQDSVIEAVKSRWKAGHDIESRTAILQQLGQSTALVSHLQNFADIISEGLDDYTTDTRGDIGSVVRIEALRAVATIWEDVKSIGDTSSSSIFDMIYPKVLRLAAEKLDKVRTEAQNAVANVLVSSDPNTLFRGYNTSSKEYFRCLLDIPTYDLLVMKEANNMQLYETLLEGYVSSADTGSEDLVRASRAALVEFCEFGHVDGRNMNIVCGSLFLIMKRNIKNDRVLIPAMEVMAFLFDCQIMQQSATNWRGLYALIQNAHYQTGNIRKLEAAVKLYGGLIDVYPEALHKLTSMLLHKFPKVRNEAADTLFAKRGIGKSVNWSKAKQTDLVEIRNALEHNHLHKSL